MIFHGRRVAHSDSVVPVKLAVDEDDGRSLRRRALARAAGGVDESDFGTGKVPVEEMDFID
jgi:hypothetical protein